MSRRTIVTALILIGCAQSRAAAQACGAWSPKAPTGSIPSPREGVLVYDSERRVVVLFGGGPSLGDTWEWNGQFWSLAAVNGPGPRNRHAMAYDAFRHRTVLFGGRGEQNEPRGETWEWDGNTWLFRTASGPSPRSGHALAFDSGRNVVVLYGGDNGAGETWEWDGMLWTQRNIPGPGSLIYHAMCYESVRGVTVLFGGVSPTGHSNYTWEYDGFSWERRGLNQPDGDGRHEFDMVFDEARERVVLFGGYSAATQRYGDTWEFDGSTWTLRTNSGPAARNLHGMAYDTYRDRIVLFGGDAGPALNDTWEYAGTYFFAQQPAATTVMEGSLANLVGFVQGPSAVTYRWYRNGSPLAAGGRYYGVDTNSLIINPTIPSDSGEFELVAETNSCGSVHSAPAVLTVLCFANCDHSSQVPVLNVVDFTCFLQRFAAGESYANCDRSTQPPVLNVADFTCFLQRFAAGCQ